MTVTVPAQMVRLADRLARSRGLSRSAVFAEALRRHIDLGAPAPAPVTEAEGGRSGAPAPARVAEPAVGPYPSGGSDIAFATDAELLAEVQRRLADPGRLVTAERVVGVDRKRLADLCRRHHITRLSVFGSALGPGFRPDSDVDVLVEFEPGRTPGFGMITIQDDLSVLFGGRRVDLVTEPGLSRRLRDPILASARVLYDAR